MIEPAHRPGAGIPGVRTSTGKVTVGVAIGLPEPHATRVQDIRRSLGDTQADVILAHITVVGPRLIEQADLPALALGLRDVAASHRSFRVEIGGAATFRPVTDVVYLRLTVGMAECAELARRARVGPLRGDDRHPYHPHVTVAQDVPTAGPAEALHRLGDGGFGFEVTELGLYVCGPDGVWRMAEHFALAPAAD